MLLSFKKDDLEKAQDCLDQVRAMLLLSALVCSCTTVVTSSHFPGAVLQAAAIRQLRHGPASLESAETFFR